MNPTRTITASIGVLESIGANWAIYEQVEAGLLPTVLRATAYDNNGHSTETPDPTGNLAIELCATQTGNVHNMADTTDALEAVLTQLRWVQNRVNTLIRQHPDIAADAKATLKALRCSGHVTRPNCESNAVSGGLCHACIKARQRTNSTVVDMSTARVLEPVASSPRPVEPNAPGHSVYCSTCRTDYGLPVSVDAQTWLSDHKATCA